MRYGMTLGELARLAGADLEISGGARRGAGRGVAPYDGARRDGSFPLRRPDPESATLESLYHYPGTCLFEGTNLCVGRGSDAPFEQVGATWLDTAAVLARVRARRLPGVDSPGDRLTPHRPGDGKYADTLVVGHPASVTDRPAYDQAVAAVHLLAAGKGGHGDRLDWTPAHFDRLAGSRVLRANRSGGGRRGWSRA